MKGSRTLDHEGALEGAQISLEQVAGEKSRDIFFFYLLQDFGAPKISDPVPGPRWPVREFGPDGPIKRKDIHLSSPACFW